MLTAGSENMPTTNPPEAGLTPSDDSQTSPNETAVTVTTQDEPPDIVPAEAEKDEKWSDLTATEQESATEAMTYMGISKRKARKILKVRGAGKYLRRGVASAIGLSAECTSMEENMRAQRAMTKMTRDKSLNNGLRIEAAKTLAALQGTMARIVDSSIAAAEKFDEAQKQPQPQSRASVQVGVNINNMPPVAQAKPRATTGLISESSPV